MSGNNVFGASNAFARDRAGSVVDAGSPDSTPAAGAGVGHKELPMVRMPGRGWLLSHVAKEIGGVLTSNGVFRRDLQPVTINPETGRMEAMSADRFRTYVEHHLVCYTPQQVKDLGEVKVVATMPVEVARGILASDDFVFQQRRIQKVNTVRQPVRRRDGRIELLPVGYDQESETVTTPSDVVIDESMSLERARSILNHILQEFPFADVVPTTPETIKDGTAGRSRSKAVQVAAMLALYAAGLVAHDARRLNFLWSANKPRSGKTLLAQLAIVPTIGGCDVQALPDTREELRKVLDSAALNASPYILFDDLSGNLSNQALNAFMTASSWSGRLMNSQRTFSVPKIATVFLTGNNLSVSADIAGRMLLCELYVEHADAQDREIRNVIDEEWLRRPQNRSDLCSALWALVREWDRAGRPARGRVLKGYETWSAMYGGIVQYAGFGDPLEAPKTETAGSTEEQDMQALVAYYAPALRPSHPILDVTFDEIVKVCVELQCFTWIIDGKWVDEDEGRIFRLTPRSNAAMGKLLCGRYGGNVFRVGDMRIRWGHRGRQRHRKYQIQLVT